MRRTLLFAMLIVTTAACESNGGNSSSSATAATGPRSLTDALARIERLPKYAPSDWGYTVIDKTTGDVVAAQNADH
ncbi:MAG: hypothetical protein LC749_02710, partial [Actinobacteria bacterium]|nr:hypothetical protein [Actinomycetota bacterium]